MSNVIPLFHCQQEADEAADAARITREAASADGQVYTALDQMMAGRRMAEDAMANLARLLGARPFDEIFADHAERVETMGRV